MKKIFALVFLLVLGKISYSQYPLTQNLGSDSTIVISKGATQSRFVNVTYSDTASANLQRIRQYPGSQIATTSGGLRFWIRNATATGWIEISTTASTVGVTSVATNNATGITGGTITSTGTLAIDTLLISTRLWRQKGIDSVASLITGSVSGTTNYVSKFTATNSLGNSQIFDNGTNVGFATATPDSLLTVELGTHLKRGVRMSGLPQAPGTKSLRIDANGTLSIVDTTSGGGSGTVTSVATNDGTGITGGTITTSGTLAIDTLIISTRAWRQKGIDSVAGLIGSGYVPYTGATQNVDLGQFGLKTKYVEFDTSSQAVTDRRLQWSNDEGTLQFGMTNGATITQRIGLEQFARVKNVQGTQINKGQVVYIYGASGDRASVKLADNRADSTSSKTLGVAAEDIAINDVGLVGTFGTVNNLDLSAYTPGDILYLDSIPGGLTKNKPQAPYHLVFIGVVERANSGNGQLFTNVQNGYELEELHNVRITSPVPNKAILLYDSVRRLWVDTTVAASGIAVTQVSTNAATGITGGPITTVGTISADTTLLSTRLWRQKGVDSLQANINLKLNISDTASMLSPYLRKIDTASLSNRINTKLNISDTSSMLTNYINNVGYGLLRTGQVARADSATLASYFLRRKDSLTSTNLLGYVTRKILADSTAAVRAASGTGTVTSVGSNTGTGLTGGPITTSGTLAIDTITISTRRWRQKGIDSVQGNLTAGLALKLNISDTSSMLSPYLRKVDTASLSNRINQKLNISDTATMLGNYVNNVGYGLLKSGQVVRADSATLANYFLRRKDSLTSTNLLGYVTRKILADTAAAIRSADAGGTVTSVATNTGTGITGGTITTSGTIAADTLLLSTRAWRQKGIDSVATLANTKVGGSGTANYISKFTGTNTIANSVIFESGTSIGINTATPSRTLDVQANSSAIHNTSLVGTNTSYVRTINTGGSLTIGIDNSAGSSLFGLNPYTAGLVYSGAYPLIIGTNGGAAISIPSTNMVGIGTASPDSLLTVEQGTLLKRGVRMSGLPTGVGTKALRIDANGRLSIADTTTAGVGTVTSVATNNGTGITGGTITGAGTLAIDTVVISTRAWRQKGIDSVQGNLTSGLALKLNISDTANMLNPYLRKVDTASLSNRINTKLNISDTSTMLGNYVNNVGYGLAKSGQVVRADSATLASYFLRRKDSLTATNLLGYVTGKILADTAAAIRAAAGGGSIGGSGTTNRIAKFTASGTIGNSSIADSSSSVAMTISSGGNLGLGVVPSAWSANSKAIQIADGFIEARTNASNVIEVGSNAFWDGSNWKYIGNSTATLYGQDGGRHIWYNAATGTAGNNISFTERMRIDASGNFGLATSTIGSRLQVNGNAAIGYSASTAAPTNGLAVAGNVGVGVIPSAWSGFSVIQGLQASVRGSSAVAGFGHNFFFNGTSNIYQTTNFASDYYQLNGEHIWRSAPSGTAGNTATFTDRMKLDASGNLGVGTSTPGNRLHVYSTNSELLRLEYSGATGGNYIQFKNSSGDIGYFGYGSISSDQMTIFQGKNADLAIFTNSAERMRILSGGNIGINTTTIGSRLQVNGNAAIGYSASTAAPTNGLLVAGNVGIGTTSPNNYGNTTVTIASSLTNNPAALVIRNSDGSLRGHYYSDGANSTMVLGSATAHPLLFVTTDTERMRITSGGLVGIGTTSISDILSIAQSSATAATIRLENTSTGRAVLQLVNNDGVTNNNNWSIEAGRDNTRNLAFRDNLGGERMRISGAGNVGIGTTSPASLLSLSGSADVGMRIKAGAANLSFIDFDEADSGAPNGSIAYNHGTNAMIFGTGGSNAERMRILSGGNIGINTTTIGSRLQVNGNAAIGYSASTAAPTNGLAVSGNVGIGLTNPAVPLDILAGSGNGAISMRGNTSNIADLYYFSNNGATLYSYIRGNATDLEFNAQGTRNLLYFTNSAERMRITSGGNVGIGTTAPSGRLHIDPADNEIGLNVSTSSLTGANAQSLVDLAQTWNTTGNPTAIKLNITNTASGTGADLMELQVGGTNQFRVTKGGAIETDNPTGGTKKPWKLGSVMASSMAYDDTRYVEVEIDGTLYYLALSTLAEPAPSPEDRQASGPSYSVQKDRPIIKPETDKIKSLEKEIAELKQLIKSIQK